MYANEYSHLQRSECRNTLTYVHTSSRILQDCDISLGLLTLPVPEAGDFVKLILLYIHPNHKSVPLF